MITPVHADFAVDTAAVTRIARRFAACGVSPLLMGTTGEGNSLSATQGLRLVEAAVAAAGGRIPVYAGLTGCCVSEQLAAAAHYARLGVDVLVATLPAYYALTDAQMTGYYRTLADAVPLPLMLYNIPSTTHLSIPLAVVEQLAAHPNIVGIKDSERDAGRMEACIALAKRTGGFAYFCGWAAQSAASLALGGDGIVPSTGNYVPELFADLYRAATAGNRARADELQQTTDAVARIYQEGRTLGQSLAALKVMMSTQGLCEPYMLPPLTRLSAADEETIILKLHTTHE
jgi:4-hydroxy-tetrahydrodipicolinate synthase